MGIIESNDGWLEAIANYWIYPTYMLCIIWCWSTVGEYFTESVRKGRIRRTGDVDCKELSAISGGANRFRTLQLQLGGRTAETEEVDSDLQDQVQPAQFPQGRTVLCL